MHHADDEKQRFKSRKLHESSCFSGGMEGLGVTSKACNQLGNKPERCYLKQSEQLDTSKRDTPGKREEVAKQKRFP